MKRLNHFVAAPQAMEILLEQENYLRQQFRDRLPLWELVKVRVSQINQCGLCVDMHGKDAFKGGESMERIIGLCAWRDMPFYEDDERIALEWADLLTEARPVSETLYQKALEHFGERGLVDLTVAVNAINSWTRLGKAFKPAAGIYQPG